MSEVFVSYKREDEARVSALVAALERHGLACWWDRGVVAGENWRARLKAELDEAGAVLVVWTKISAGSHGMFVQGDASHAQRRGKLVPVLLDKVTPPLGFGEVPAIDLSHWHRGITSRLSGGRLGASHRDPFVLDLVAALRATIAGQPAPKPRGRLRRLYRRLTWGGMVSALALAGAAFATNTLRLQDQACNLDIGQPELSDTCAELGLGNRPSRAERLAWSARPKASCQGLRDFVGRFPTGVYAASAAALINARTIGTEQRWAPVERALPTSGSATGHDRDSAEQAAQADAQAGAELVCRNAATTSEQFRYRATTLDALPAQCQREVHKLWICQVDTVAHCQLDEASEVRTEHCE